MTSHDLKCIANRLRIDVVESIHAAKDGHPGPCMSIAEILSVLYFKEMNIDSTNPAWPQRDRMVLSKGHACPILYAALARKGYFDISELSKLRTLDSFLQGHPDMNKTPGIDTVSGSLGNGVSIGLGMALGCKMQNIENYVYVIVGDGEQEEGIVWEAAMAAAKAKAGRLIVLADCNNYQSGGKVTEISSLYPVSDKWEAFHWHVQSIDGHNIDEICEAIADAKKEVDRPSFIECKTVKGKGIPYMENNNLWHKRIPTEEEVNLAKEALRGEIWE